MNSSSVLACVGAEFNKPFVQTSQATYFCPQNRHSLLAETNPCPVDFANQFHRRMLVLPGHRTRKPHNGLHAVEQIAIQRFSSNVLTALHRIVFTVVRRIVGQLQSQTGSGNEVD